MKLLVVKSCALAESEERKLLTATILCPPFDQASLAFGSEMTSLFPQPAHRERHFRAIVAVSDATIA